MTANILSLSLSLCACVWYDEWCFYLNTDKNVYFSETYKLFHLLFPVATLIPHFFFSWCKEINEEAKFSNHSLKSLFTVSRNGTSAFLHANDQRTNVLFRFGYVITLLRDHCANGIGYRMVFWIKLCCNLLNNTYFSENLLEITTRLLYVHCMQFLN